MVKKQDKIIEKKGISKKDSIKKSANKGEVTGKACSILSYLFIGIIWYFIDKKQKQSSFAKYHVKQSLILLIAVILYSIILGIVFSSLFISILRYIPLIWVVIGIINSVNGKEKELPLIGRFAKIFSF